MKNVNLAQIIEFLGCETPSAWIQQALVHQDLMLIDHAHCEKKAASTALNLMFRYVEKGALLRHLSKLAREELRHFEQVLDIMDQRGVRYQHLSPARYAEGLRRACRTHEPGRLVDILIVGAFIEARSCERFAALAPHLDPELRHFYESLLRSESRHYQMYLSMAQRFGTDCESRITHFRQLENALILEPDTEFRFHSGPLEVRVNA
ncbi:MAG: tRNA-(ms[2]io[6]A)-hydroxylase [Acidobacteria bacterium]|nr:tRNA-(ms[2]io[6]A)-hydroxylase [Acidobacteriota bacterium]MCB9398889.1 tRNA-(ms[2]io[6]A)-hydroxylase [Acidobacteriota bacterium]